MDVSSEAIVLKTTSYSDTSLIVKVFSKNYGVQSYLAKGVKSKKSKNKLGLFQPLSILNITGVKSKSDLLILKEAKFAVPYQEVQFDVYKSSVLFFVNEFLYRVFLADDFSDNQLYDFIKKSALLLDSTKESVTNFHLVFLAHFTQFMGIFPNNAQNGRFFDITEGTFSHRAAIPYLDEKTSIVLKSVLETPMSKFHSTMLTKQERKQLLNGLLLYYKTHIDGFRDMKSLDVLKTVLND